MKAIRFLKNKYLIATVLFLVWMLFFDHNNIFLHLQYRKEVNELKTSKKYYQEQIDKTREEVELIKTNPQALEKVAREQYLMKKDNEDVFVVKEWKGKGCEKGRGKLHLSTSNPQLWVNWTYDVKIFNFTAIKEPVRRF